MRHRALSFNLNLVDLSETGFWFCRCCQRVTEPVEHDERGGILICKLCDSPRIKFCPPVFSHATPQGHRDAHG